MRRTLTALAALAIAFGPVAAQTGSQSASSQSQPTIKFLTEQTQDEVLGTDFIGTPVATKGGEQVGRISNLVFGKDGSIELAVIGIGGFLGIGEKEVAVAFDNLKSDTVNNKHVFVIDVTKDQIKAAPAYKTISDQKFKERVAEWRAKASQSWSQMKQQATKAYEEAKTKVNEATKPADQPVAPKEQPKEQ